MQISGTEQRAQKSMYVWSTKRRQKSQEHPMGKEHLFKKQYGESWTVTGKNNETEPLSYTKHKNGQKT